MTEQTPDILTNLRVFYQGLRDSERTLFCEPDLESRLKCTIAAAGLGGIYTVQAHPACPPGQVLVVDENAIEADQRQQLQTMRFREGLFDA